MNLLNHSTRRRLKTLRQIPSVWEGDRYPLHQSPLHEALGDSRFGDCILWVDGLSAQVRAMEMVSPEVGREAIVRVLLRAMEQPHSSNNATGPARPQKIVVRNRELQFFLRGILQDLDITVQYAADLPIIDEILQGLQTFLGNPQPTLPPQYADALQSVAVEIWQDAPWRSLSEEKIIAIQFESQDQDIDTLYISFLGLLGVEFGVLMYRSQDSLKSFRQRLLAIDDAAPEQLEELFLQQDCFFMTFETTGDPDDQAIASPAIGRQSHNNGVDIVPEFGSLHPLEGMRPIVHDDEALVVLVTLKALHTFFQQHHQAMDLEQLPTISHQYSITAPDPNLPDPITVTVSTMPELTQELERLAMPSQTQPSKGMAIHEFNADTVPSGTLSQCGQLSWDLLTELRISVKVYQAAEFGFPMDGEAFPIILLQTSRPKALRLIETIQQRGGIASVGFLSQDADATSNPQEIGMFHTHDGAFHIFSEHKAIKNTPSHKRWETSCQQTNGYCGLIIAKGVTGSARGNPSPKDMLALFESRSLRASSSPWS